MSKGAQSKGCAPFLCRNHSRRPIGGHGAFDLTRRGLFAPALGLLAAACAPLGVRFGVDDGWSRDVRRVVQGLPYGDDPRQRIDLYAPRGARGHAVLVFLGGDGARVAYEAAARFLAAQGFVVCVVDGRPAFVADAASAVAHAAAVASVHGGEPGRLGVIGHGAGAGSALMIALDRRYMAAVGQPDLIRAAAGLSGVYGVADTHDLTHTQPVAYVRGTAPPIWLGYGADGGANRMTEAVTLDQRIRAAGGRSEVHAYPDLSVPAPALQDAAGFFRRVLG